MNMNSDQRNRRPKKDTLCSFYKNCRNGDRCEYFHPSHGKKGGNGSKNYQEEMYKEVHFLKKQMMEMVLELKGMKKDRKKRREEEKPEKMH